MIGKMILNNALVPQAIVSAAWHLHVGMTLIQNGGYCCLEFLLGFNYPSFFLGRKRFRGVH